MLLCVISPGLEGILHAAVSLAASDAAKQKEKKAAVAMCDNVDGLQLHVTFLLSIERAVDLLKGFTWRAGGYSGTPVDSAFECAQAEGFEHVLCVSRGTLGTTLGRTMLLRCVSCIDERLQCRS